MPDIPKNDAGSQDKTSKHTNICEPEEKRKWIQKKNSKQNAVKELLQSGVCVKICEEREDAAIYVQHFTSP